MDDDELLAAIQETFPILDGWRDTLSEVILPPSGSALARDDEEWPYASASALVSIGLASAREHLHAVRLLIEARELFPAAASTLCRSALIGGSLAVWMLIPDEPEERLRRSLSLAVEDYKRHIQFGAAVKEHFLPGLVAPTADEQLDRLELRRSQVMSLLADVGGLLEVNLTDDVIPSALEYAVPNPPQRAQMLVRWRSMSGAAHALAWHYFGYDGTSATDLDPGGVGRIAIGGDIGRLAMDYFPPFHVAAAGWRLLDERCRVPEP
jgi:hypothetical protein